MEVMRRNRAIGLLLGATLALWAFPPLCGQTLEGGEPETTPQGVFRIGEGVSSPTLLRSVDPKYSEEARQSGVEGTIRLYVVVGEDGVPRDLRVVNGLGYGLDEEAMRAVQQWRFRPGELKSKPVAVAATIEVNFRLFRDETLAEVRERAARGDPVAINMLGTIDLRGEGVQEDIEAGIKQLRIAAESGKSYAQYNLASQYYQGKNVEQDIAEALRWFQEAAEQGLVDAQVDLDMMYYQGEGVPQDATEAARWLRKAADKGSLEAQYHVGLLYERGEGVGQNLRTAASWFQKAADRGYASAQYQLGVLYTEGRGVKRDDVQAYMWLKLAEAKGRTDATSVLTVLTTRMSPEQIGNARRLAEDWRPTSR